MNEPIWFRKHKDISERFAHAVENGRSDRDDAEFDRELMLMSALRDLGAEPALDDSARARILSSIEANLTGTATALDQRPPSKHLIPVRARRSLLITAAAAAAFLIAGALGVQLAQNALPGDLLYEIKRTTESIALDFTFEPSERAFKHLELAAERVSELEELASRYTDGGAADPSVYQAVLDDLDEQASAASRGVTELSTQHGGSLLPMLRDWAAEQSDRMTTIQAATPGVVLARFASSLNLLEQIEHRAERLASRMECYRITSGAVDKLGQVPAEGACDISASAKNPSVIPSASSKGMPAKSQASKSTTDSGAPVTPAEPSEGTDPVAQDPAESPEAPGPEVPPVDDVDPEEPTGPSIPTLVPPPSEIVIGAEGLLTSGG